MNPHLPQDPINVGVGGAVFDSQLVQAQASLTVGNDLRVVPFRHMGAWAAGGIAQDLGEVSFTYLRVFDTQKTSVYA